MFYNNDSSKFEASRKQRDEILEQAQKEQERFNEMIKQQKTLRDEMAIAAMVKIISMNPLATQQEVAEKCYSIADAMLKQREVKE